MDFDTSLSSASSQLSLSSSASVHSLPIRKFCFQILYHAFRTNPKGNKATRTQTFVLYMFGVLQVAFSASLLLSDCGDPGFVSTVRELLTLIRYDSVFVRYSLDTEFLIAHFCALLLPVLSFSAEFLFKVCTTPDRRMPLQSIRYLIAWPVRYFQMIGFVPVLVLLQAKVCVWLTGRSTVVYQLVRTEAPDEWSSTDGGLAFLFTLILVLLMLCGLFFDYNVYYNSRKRSFLARARSFEYFLHVCGKVAAFAILIWTYESNKFWVEAVFAISGGVTGYVFITRAPFYDFNCNVVFAWTSVSMGWVGVAKFIGRITERNEASVLLMLVVLPVLLVILYSYMQSAQSVVISLASHSNFSQVEKVIRAHIERMEATGGIVKEEIQKLFRQLNSGERAMNTLNLFEAAFYAHECDDYEKAWIALIKFKWGEPSLESQFQRFKLQEYIRSVFHSAETVYLEHMTRMDAMKALDEQCCWDIYNLCAELQDPHSSSKKCENLADRVSRSINILCKEYRAALATQPKNVQLHFMFGTFMSDILSDPAGQVFIQRAETNANHIAQRGASDSFTSFDTAGTICINCTRNRMGMVDLLNDKALELLGLTRSDLVSLHMTDLVPEGLRNSMREVLADVVFERKPMSALLAFFSTILDSHGFLLALKPYAKAISHDDLCFIFLSFHRDLSREAVALVDAGGFLLYHSQRLGEFTRFSGTEHFAGFCLREIFPELPERWEERVEVGLPQFPSFGLVVRKVDLCRGHKPLFQFAVVRLDSSKLPETSSSMRLLSLTNSRKEVRFSERRVSIMEHSEALDQLHGTVLTNTQAEHSRKDAGTRGSQANSEASFAVYHLPAEESLMAKVRLTSRRLKWLLLIANVLVIATVLATSVFMLNLVTQMQELTSLTKISQRRHLSIDIASLTRDASVETNPEKLLTLQNAIRDGVSSFRSSIDMIKEDFTKWPEGPSKSIYTSPSTVIVERINSALRISMVDLFECMYKFVDNAMEVANAADISKAQASVYYVLRNGPSESLLSLNRSMFTYVEAESVYRDECFQLIETLVLLSGVVLVVSIAVLVAPQVCLLEKYHRLTWHALYAIHQGLIVDLKNRARDRLQSMHFNEIIDAEIRVKDSKKRGKPTRVWPRVALKLFIIFGISLAYFLGVFVGVYPSLKLLLRTMPNYINWGGIRSTVTHSTSFWLHENFHVNYSNYFRDNSLWESPQIARRNSTETYRFVFSLLRGKNPAYGIHHAQDTVAYKEYRYKDACYDGNNITDCGNGPISLGLNYAILEFIETAEHYGVLQNSGQGTEEEMDDIDRQKTHLFAATTHGLNFYRSQSDSQIKAQSTVMIVATTLYCGGLLALFFVYDLAVINNLARKLCDRAALLKILKTK